MVKILYRFVCHFSNIDTDFISIEEGRDVRRDKQSLSRAFHIDARLDDHFTTSALTVMVVHPFSHGMLTILERAIYEFRFWATVRNMYLRASCVRIIAAVL